MYVYVCVCVCVCVRELYVSVSECVCLRCICIRPYICTHTHNPFCTCAFHCKQTYNSFCTCAFYCKQTYNSFCRFPYPGPTGQSLWALASPFEVPGSACVCISQPHAHLLLIVCWHVTATCTLNAAFVCAFHSHMHT